MARHIPSKEVAKLIKKQLKATFPTVKFSIRSDYNAIRVRWEDGPTAKMVDAIADQYSGGGFDGMIDMAYSYTSWLLPNGKAMLAECSGTAGSRGTVPASSNPKPHPDAELVQFSSKYIFTSRELTLDFQQRCLEKVQLNFSYGQEFLPRVKAAKYIEEKRSSYTFIKLTDDVYVPEWRVSLSDLVHKESARRSTVIPK